MRETLFFSCLRSVVPPHMHVVLSHPHLLYRPRVVDVSCSSVPRPLGTGKLQLRF